MSFTHRFLVLPDRFPLMVFHDIPFNTTFKLRSTDCQPGTRGIHCELSSISWHHGDDRLWEIRRAPHHYRWDSSNLWLIFQINPKTRSSNYKKVIPCLPCIIVHKPPWWKVLLDRLIQWCHPLSLQGMNQWVNNAKWCAVLTRRIV